MAEPDKKEDKKEARRAKKEQKKLEREERRAARQAGEPEFLREMDEPEEDLCEIDEGALAAEALGSPAEDEIAEEVEREAEEEEEEEVASVTLEEMSGPAEELPEIPEPEEERKGWLRKLREGLSRSRSGLTMPLSRALAGRRFDDAFWEEAEEILISADVGLAVSLEVVEEVKKRLAALKVKEPEEALQVFKDVVAEKLSVGDTGISYNPDGVTVILVVGVNGTGKTTTIAKLANHMRSHGKTVILAAADTFRAAAIEQLEVWGERVGVHTVKHRPGSDSAAVAYDAVEAAQARGIAVVIVDTAGRLHTKVNLMEELKKIKRIVERKAPVSEVLLVLDATTGQNGLVQAQQFQDAVGVTGIVLTKLDGTAKGGIVVAIEHELGIPIKFIGVGEKMHDLLPFDAASFSEALFS